MKRTKHRQAAVWQRSACSLVVALLTCAYASPLFAGFIQTEVDLIAETDVTVVAPFGVTSDPDFEQLGRQPPPANPLLTFVDANSGLFSSSANAAIDAAGNFGLRTVLRNSDGIASASVTYLARWNLSIVPANIEFVWLVGPLDIAMFGARDATVEVRANTSFNSAEFLSALLTVEIDPLGNVTSELNVNGVDQGPLPVVTNGDLVSLTDFRIPIPIAYLENRTDIAQQTSVGITVTTGSAAPEGIFVGLDDPFNLSGDPATSVLFFDTPTTVVPEPSSLTLLASGLIGLWGYVWRRRKKRPSTAA